VSKSTSGTGTHRARPVFATPLEMRPALPRLVDVAPGERLQLADAHPRRVEHERRQAVGSGEEADDGLNVRGYWRLDFAPLLARQLHGQPIACRVRLNPR